jgi:hypothetical protein
MLSSEGSLLARLILERHTLICRAIDLDMQFEVLALLESTQDGCCADSPAATDVRVHFSDSRKRLSADVELLPALVDDLEAQIERAWRRLDRVSPRIAE